MANDCLFVREVLLALADEWTQLEGDSKKVNELVDEVQGSLYSQGLRPLQTHEIKGRFKADGNESVSMPLSGLYLILRGPERGAPMVPVIGLDVHMQGSTLSRLKVSLALYLRDDHDETFSVKALGYRFEMSEGPGTHDFCHAQNVREFNPARYLPLGAATWVPDSQPSFPLRATTPLELLVCALVTIYGTRILDRLGERIDSIRDHFKIDSAGP